jgi:hypothetical protein
MMAKAVRTPEELDRDIENKAWGLFNEQLNQGLDWPDAKAEALRIATAKRDEWMDKNTGTPTDTREFDSSLRHFNKFIDLIGKIPAA